jgi:hypothetical protein
MNDKEHPPRERVTGPRGGRSRPMSVTSHINAQTEIGELYVRTLVRSQLRLALGTAAILVLTVGSLPLIFLLLRSVADYPVFGVPVAWILLGAGVYPILLLLAWGYLRRAERNEAAFDDLVHGPQGRR